MEKRHANRHCCGTKCPLQVQTAIDIRYTPHKNGSDGDAVSERARARLVKYSGVIA